MKIELSTKQTIIQDGADTGLTLQDWASRKDAAYADLGQAHARDKAAALAKANADGDHAIATLKAQHDAADKIATANKVKALADELAADTADAKAAAKAKEIAELEAKLAQAKGS